MRRIGILASTLVLLLGVATPALADTTTDHNVVIELNDPDNPCGPGFGETLAAVVLDHFSSAANDSLHFTHTETGTFALTRDPAGKGPVATGRYTIWVGANQNTNQAGFWLTLRAKGEFEDGTLLQFSLLIQERSTDQPNFIQFNCHDGNGPVRVPTG